MLWPLRFPELRAQTNALHELVPQLVELLALAVGGGGHFEHEPSTRPGFAIPVTVAIDVAIDIEQRLGLAGLNSASGPARSGSAP